MGELETKDGIGQEVVQEDAGAQAQSQYAVELKKNDLDKESLELIGQIIEEKDVGKAKDLTYLFNLNQNKKTMIRVNKMNDLLDVIADQTMARFSERPDEISNQELLQGMKVVQDILERGQKQIAGAEAQPLIQVNQQNNEINLGEVGDTMSRESRDRVKNAVLAILASAKAAQTDEKAAEGASVSSDEAIEVDLIDAEGDD